MAVLTRVASRSVPAPEITFVRFLVGLAGAGAYWLVRRDAFRSHAWGLLVLRGVLGGAAVLLYFVAIERCGAGVGSLLNYMHPVFAAIFASMFLGERLSRTFAIGLALATVGVTMVLGGFTIFLGESAVPWGVGHLAGAASAVLGGGAVTTIRAARATESSASIFGSFCIAGAFISAGPALTHWTAPDVRGWALLVSVGVLGLGAQVVMTYAFKFITAGAGAAVSQLVPVLAFVLSWVFLDERLTPTAVVGAFLVVVGMVFAQRGEPEAALETTDA